MFVASLMVLARWKSGAAPRTNSCSASTGSGSARMATHQDASWGMVGCSSPITRVSMVALIAGVLGVSGVAGVATNIAYVLFVVAIVLFLVHLLTGRRTLTP